jgi:3-dehydroquinate synthase
MGLPTHPNQIDAPWKAATLLEYMKQDKKVSNGLMAFILVTAIGNSFISYDIPEKDVTQFIETYLCEV